MAKKTLSIFVSLIILFSLVACKPTYTFILEDTACNPPCWNDITPGISTEAEAVFLLKNNPQVINSSIDRNIDVRQETINIYWDFFDKPGAYGFIKIRQGKVEGISFFPSYGKIALRLTQLFQEFGEPGKVLSVYNSNSLKEGEIYFYYEEQGILATYSLKLEKPKFRHLLQPESPISSFAFIDPNHIDEAIKSDVIQELIDLGFTDEQLQDSWHDWKGYGEIKIKYPTSLVDND